MIFEWLAARRTRARLLTICVAAVVATCAGIALADDAEQDLIVFTSVDGERISEAASGLFDDSDITPRVDLIYSRSWERFRLFGELLITDDEQELERMQFGWQLSEGSRVWLGRFHHSGSYWNTEHHHGQFLQTSISRPAIEEFEDTGGVLPLHVTGVLLEQREEFDWGSALQLSLSAGLTGRIEDMQIEAFDLLSPDSGFESGINVRVAYLPDALGENQLGVTLGKHNVALDDATTQAALWDPSANEIELETLGVYADWRWEKWRFFGSVLRVSTAARGGVDGANRDFTASYLQGEYGWTSAWRLFARIEDTSGDESYLDLFPHYIRRQSVFGVRWSIGTNHALTFEGTNSEAHRDHFHRFAVQWSAVFP